MKFRKICFFLPSAQKDGAELSALECMDTLKSQGLECHVVIPQKGPLIAELEKRQLPIKIIPYKVWVERPVPVWQGFLVTLWNLFITYVAILLISRWKCDLIITNTINICVGALVAKILRLPHIWYIREFGYEDHGWRFHLGEKSALWIMDRLSDACLAVSRAVAQKYQASITPSKVTYLYQPINLDESTCPPVFLDKKKFRLTFIMVGRLQDGKRQEDAIRALAEVRNRGLQVQLWLVGGGDRDYCHFLKGLVGEKNLAGCVRFFGQVDNALPYIRQADVLLLCSRCEAFARVVIEAMKCGKPVIGTRSGGTMEQIEEGFNGFLYEPKNYKELAEKITVLYDHRKLINNMGMNGKKWAIETFNQDSYLKKLITVLGQL